MSTTSPYVTNDQFRSDFPAFKDPDLYQNASLTMYLTLAGNMLSSQLWADLWTIGQELFAAHFLVVDALDEKNVERGRMPPSGPIQNKSVGAASIAYSEGAMELRGGHWNMTNYGRRFLRFARLVGAGGSQLNGTIPLQPNWFPGSATSSSLPFSGPPDYNSGN